MKRWLMGSAIMVTAVMLCSQSALAGRLDIGSRGALEAPTYSDFNRPTGGATGWTGEELLLRNPANGNLWLTYFTNGVPAWPVGSEPWSNMVVNAMSAGTAYSSNAADLLIDAIADVNGDGQSEVVVRSQTPNAQSKTAARVLFFDDNGTGQVRTNQPASFPYHTKWTIEGAGNFNTNSYSFNTHKAAQELLLRNANNGNLWLTYFTENGVPAWGDGTYSSLETNVVQNYALSSGTSYVANASSWTISAVGDMDGNGKDDVVFHNGNVGNRATNALVSFSDNGIAQMNPNVFSYNAKWVIEGAGNFNTNLFSFNPNRGAKELLLRNPVNGNLWLSYFNENGVIAWPDGTYSEHESNVVANYAMLVNTSYSTNATAWTVHAIGDVNSDGKDEIVLRTSVTTGTGAATKSQARVLFFDDNGQLQTSGQQPAPFDYKTKWVIEGFNAKK